MRYYSDIPYAKDTPSHICTNALQVQFTDAAHSLNEAGRGWRSSSSIIFLVSV